MNLSSQTNILETSKQQLFQDDNNTYFPFYKIKLTKPEPFISEYKRNLKDLFSKTQKLLSFGDKNNFSYQFNLRRSWLNFPNKASTRNNIKKNVNKINQSYKHINKETKNILLSPLPNKVFVNKHKHIIINSKNNSPLNFSKTQNMIEQHHNKITSQHSAVSSRTNSKTISPKVIKLPFNYKKKKLKQKQNEQYGRITNALENMIYTSECFTKQIEVNNNNNNNLSARNSVSSDEIKAKMQGIDFDDFNALIDRKKNKEMEDDRLKFLRNKKDVFLRYGLVNLIDFGDCYSKLDPAYCLQNKNDIYKRYNDLRRELHIIKDNKSSTQRSFSYIFKNKISAIDLYYKTKDIIATLLNNKTKRSSSL